MSMEQHIETAKGVTNWVSLTMAAGAVVNILPPIAALFSILWSALMIWESKTVQDWLSQRKAKNANPPGPTDTPVKDG